MFFLAYLGSTNPTKKLWDFACFPRWEIIGIFAVILCWEHALKLRRTFYTTCLSWKIRFGDLMSILLKTCENGRKKIRNKKTSNMETNFSSNTQNKGKNSNYFLLIFMWFEKILQAIVHKILSAFSLPLTPPFCLIYRYIWMENKTILLLSKNLKHVKSKV